MSKRPLCFFLGGGDLEMREIERLAREAGASVVTRDLAWGARLSAYATDIENAAARGAVCVAVELEDDMPTEWKARGSLVLIDHHGERAQGPSSLRQAFSLLGLPEAAWTRRLALVEANDVGHIEAMRAAGATPDEIARIRREDRAAQGITPQEEEAGAQALRAAEIRDGWTIVRLPHARCAAVTDPFALDETYARWPRNLLVCSPGEVNAFAEGSAIRALDEAFPGGWSGGELPRRGYWGHALSVGLSRDDVLCRLPRH